DAANRLVEALDAGYSLSVDKFAQTVCQHLDRQGRSHRLLFMVDEVGQYIGERTPI
ncbi:MAG: hypothetical protein HC790_12515, partial [Acaryochloridaceae cyanobacterium CSU_3_4]|nr:hypothetical protein [Acaryochloridaceae cyanobacterium CSU_3_4]